MTFLPPQPAPPENGLPSGFPGDRRGWVFYDGVCPVCLSLVARLGGLFRRRGFAFVPLQEPWVAPALGVAPEELRREMKLRRPDGKLLGGMDAWRELGRSVGWLRPLVWLAGWPGLRGLADAAYRWVAANRSCLSGVCPVPVRRPAGGRHGPVDLLELP